MLKVILAVDHGGWELREGIKGFLAGRGIETEDVGAQVYDELDDFPPFVDSLTKAVKKQDAIGILVCGSGIGVCMAANRVKGIRAALCHSVEYAEMSRLHNDANVLCLGGRYLEKEEVFAIIDKFLQTKFLGGKYQRRLELIDN